METKIYETEGIGNYYGSLKIKVVDGNYSWAIENYDGDHWEEIPAELGAMIIAKGNVKNITDRDY